MSNLLTAAEVSGLRQDFDEMLGELVGNTPNTEAHMTVSITRTSPSSVTVDPDTAEVVSSTGPQVIYAGPAYIAPIIFRRDRQEIAGGTAQRIRQYRCLLPWDSGDIKIDDKIEVLTSLDPQFVGKVFDVSDVMYEAEMAARRITLTDTSPTGGDCD